MGAYAESLRAIYDATALGYELYYPQPPQLNPNREDSAPFSAPELRSTLQLSQDLLSEAAKLPALVDYRRVGGTLNSNDGYQVVLQWGLTPSRTLLQPLHGDQNHEHRGISIAVSRASGDMGVRRFDQELGGIVSLGTFAARDVSAQPLIILPAIASALYHSLRQAHS